MFSLALIVLPHPVTVLMPAMPRLRVVPAAPTPMLPGQGVEETFEAFDACFRINPVTRTIHAELPPLPHALLIYGPEDFGSVAAETPEQHAERVLEVLGSDPAATLQTLIDGGAPPLPQRVPRAIPSWRCKAILKVNGLFDAVEALIAALPPEQKLVIGTAWADGADVERNGPTVAAITSALSLTASQVDAMFIAAHQLAI